MSLITASLGRIAAPERRTMGVACGAHVLHDGYTDLLYVLLPLWQAEFGLGYAEVGLLRALYYGPMAALQVPAGFVAERIGGPLLLGTGTALAGAGYLIAGASTGFALLIVALVIGAPDVGGRFRDRARSAAQDPTRLSGKRPSPSGGATARRRSHPATAPRYRRGGTSRTARSSRSAPGRGGLLR